MLASLSIYLSFSPRAYQVSTPSLSLCLSLLVPTRCPHPGIGQGCAGPFVCPCSLTGDGSEAAGVGRRWSATSASAERRRRLAARGEAAEAAAGRSCDSNLRGSLGHHGGAAAAALPRTRRQPRHARGAERRRRCPRRLRRRRFRGGSNGGGRACTCRHEGSGSVAGRWPGEDGRRLNVGSGRYVCGGISGTQNADNSRRAASDAHSMHGALHCGFLLAHVLTANAWSVRV